MQLSGKVSRLLLIAASCYLYSCTSNVQAPVESPGSQSRNARSATKPLSVKQSRQLAEKPAYYVVRRDDTLYSIAWNYGYDYRDVAAWNGIRSPYIIYPGQKISLRPPAKASSKSATKPLQQGPIVSKKPETAKQPGSVKVTPDTQKQKQKPVALRKPVTANGALHWSWPAKGRIIQADTPISKNGIDISGSIGQQILAAAPGEVVYSGSGLLGYGRLIIIKHDDTYLSAYAHNKELLVKEGVRVSVGQKIALMGQTSNGRTLLHFEIRKNGQPVNPLTYLPKI